MKINTKSSITLPPAELDLVLNLMKRLGAKTKVEVIRRGLELLRDRVERDRLRVAYALASQQTRTSLTSELDQLEHLSDEGLD